MGSKFKPPNGWAYPKARDIFESITDKTHNGKLQVLSATQDKGVIPRDKVDIDIRFSDDALLNYKRVRKGNFVIHLRSFQGGLAYSAIEGIISPAYVVLAPKVEICDNFFRFYFTSKDFIKRLKVAVYGIRDGKQISYDSFGMINILLPPLDEQKKIAEILMTQDNVIALKEKLLEAKKKQKKWFMQKFLMNQNWQIVKLERLFNRLLRKNVVGNGNVLTISANHGLISQESYFKKTIASSDLSNYFLLYKGDFAYNKSYSENYPYGAIKRLDKYEMGVVSPLYICFTPTSSNKCPEFYMHYFESLLLDREIKAISQEGARNHGLLNIAIDDFFSMGIPFPPFELQQKIAQQLSVADKEIELLTKDLESQKSLKQYLMQQLLTGKIRV